MTSLLQELLQDRRSDCLLLFRSHALCSCGKIFNDYIEAENHLVQHDKTTTATAAPNQIDYKSIRSFLAAISTVLDEAAAPADRSNSSRRISVPEDCFYVLLGEREIGGGILDDFECANCKLSLNGFQEVESHYRSCHLQDWQPEIAPGKRILVSKQDVTEQLGKGERCCPSTPAVS